MPRILQEAALLLLLAATGAVGSYFWHPAAPPLYAVQEPPREDEVTVEQIRERWRDDVLWLDARPRDQYDKAHVPGALPLNEQEFDELLLGLLDRLQTNTKPVVIYCGGARCEASRKVRERLLEVVSIDQCRILKGGWPAWTAARGPGSAQAK